MLNCGYEVPATEKHCGSKKARPSATAAVEMAQAIARSRLQDYVSTPLVRLQPTCTTSSWTDDYYHGICSTGDGDPDAGTVDRVPSCFDKLLLIPPPRLEEGRQTHPAASQFNVYLNDYKSV